MSVRVSPYHAKAEGNREDGSEREAEATHPNPSHAITAKSVSVAVTPIVLISGSMPAVVNAMISARKDLWGARRRDELRQHTHG